MATPLSTDALLARNKAYLPSHQPIPSLKELLSSGSPVAPVLVITCCDPRCIPENFLSLTTGDAVTIRNAGGNIEMAIPNIVALDTLLNFKEIMVIKHTDCGSQVYTTDGVKGVLHERAPGKAEEIDGLELGSIAGETLEQGLREQIGAVKGSELVREVLKQSIRAFVYDLTSGDVREVGL